MPASILKKRPGASASTKRAPSPPAAPSSGEDDYSDANDSEEDEWAAERTHAGPSRSRSFEQDDDDDDDDDEMGEAGSDGDEEDGVAAYESDQGELIEDDSDPEASIGKQLAEIPFTSLLKAQKQLKKQQGKSGGKGKARDEDEGEPDEEQSAGRHGRARKGKGKGRAEHEGRSNKHAPTEMSAKRPVSRVRQVVETQTLHARDPRFDALSGSVNPHLFKQSYGFLADKQRAELDTMRKTAAQARRNRALPEEEKERIEEALRRMENRDVTRKMKEREQEAMKSWKKEEQDKRAQGKKAFYLKESERKKLFLKAKFDELSTDKRKLHKAIDKKRKKTAQKEKKAMPNMRPSTGR
ncbi:uncharacterized protein RHOBADRAFT_45165 [Rhodotorula graminis WP1]|uniref:rRNA biogenesis protein RRP36 n=1 Tax=Rhodotorula graminis (strain WP1) TaxID=578459 RepID=A0A0P9H1L4_RHOGW|nr:uncharacterized protein RHOBADRAFT_45165 [Rhodotorula graminis WP1]KPV73873.1 hypothetical protein RHOBADRAFT_45165 [Rhodotorula graminis WP1]